MLLTRNLFLAFPQEFIQFESIASCKESRSNILRVFKPATPSLNAMIDNSNTASECEMYCALKKGCWGCINISNEKFQWNAVTECKMESGQNETVTQSLSQKPGMLFPTYF